MPADGAKGSIAILPNVLAEAEIAQRDASRKLYFMAAGCLYHPLAHLVIKGDPVYRAELQLAIETAYKAADLSEEEAAAFRERAVAATRVVKTDAGTYAFKQPDRPPRRCQTDANPAPAWVIARAIAVGLAVVAALFIWPVLVSLLL